jgi:hypothetical protein
MTVMAFASLSQVLDEPGPLTIQGFSCERIGDVDFLQMCFCFHTAICFLVVMCLNTHLLSMKGVKEFDTKFPPYPLNGQIYNPGGVTLVNNKESCMLDEHTECSIKKINVYGTMS